MPAFDKESARRIAEAAKWVEGQYRNDAPKSRGPKPSPTKKYALVTTAITAANGTTYGQGKGKLQLVAINPTTKVATRAPMSYPDVDIYHGGARIDVGRLIQVCVIDGAWHVDVDYCP